MLGIVLLLIILAIGAGFVGARIERRRSSSITKREANELRREVAAIQLAHGEHWDVHKVITYQVEGLAADIITIAHHVGLERVSRVKH